MFSPPVFDLLKAFIHSFPEALPRLKLLSSQPLRMIRCRLQYHRTHTHPNWV